MRPRMAGPGLLSPLLLLSAAACGGGGGEETPDVGVADSVGIRIVENRGPDRPAPWTPVRVAELVPPDSALGAFPWGVAADPERGRIYVADRRAPRIVVLDRSGAYRETLGRPGSGPGEWRKPAALAVGPGGALTVWDAGRGVVTRWSAEGDLLDERHAPVSYWGPGVYEAGDRLLTVTSERAGTAMRQALVRLGPGDTTVLHAVPREMVVMELPCIRTPASRLFAPSLVWTAAGDTAWVLDGPAYRIDRYVAGAHVASVRRPVAPLAVTAEMAAERARLEYGAFLRRCGVTPDRLVEAVGHEERIAAVQWLARDPRGRLWVTRSPNGVDPDRVDVLAATGRYRGTLDASVMPVAFVSATRFVGLELREATGETALSVYDLRGPPSAEDGGSRAAGPKVRGESGGLAGGGGGRRPAGRPAARTGLREFRDCPDCPVMVELQPGRYLMGAPDGEAPAAKDPTRPAWTEEAEKPQVEVTIDYRLAIGKYEVTFDEWGRCVEAGGCDYEPDDGGWGRGPRPVIHVARTDAERYVEWLSERTGRAYRLPSEAEWEYAARAGTATAYWWGDEVGAGRVPCDGCGTRWDERSTAPVGSFPPNPWGLHDMLSNVEEWVADCWHPTNEGNPGDGSPRVESSEWWRAEGWEDRRGEPCRRPAERGGAFSYYPWALRAAARSYYWPAPTWTERKSDTRGFRVASTVSETDLSRPVRPGERAEGRGPSPGSTCGFR